MGLHDMIYDETPATGVPAGELDTMVLPRIHDLANRFDAILNHGQNALDRRYGKEPEADANSAALPIRRGSLGAVQDYLDRLDRIADRASVVIDRLGAL